MPLKKSSKFSLIGLALAVVCFAIGLTYFLAPARRPPVDVAQQEVQPSGGTVELYGLKVGASEEEIRRSNFTFEIDEPSTPTNGSTFYRSRFRDELGGRYIARCVSGKCYRLDAFYETPITATKAKVVLKKLIPVSDHFTQVNLVPGHEPEGQAPSRSFMFGKRYAGMLFYGNIVEGKVREISAFDLQQEKLLKRED